MNIKKEYCLCKSLLWFQVSSFHFLGQHFRESQLSGLGDYIQLCVCLSARQKPFLARKKCILYNYQPSFFCGCEFVWQGAFQISRRGLSAFPNSKSYIELFFFSGYLHNYILTRLLCLNRNIGSRLTATAATGRTCTVLSRSGNWIFLFVMISRNLNLFKSKVEVGLRSC